MKNFWIVTKYELSRYFISPLAYIYLVSFLILNAACAFYFGHFFERAQADLFPMFAYQPWLYLLFASGISMRLWAEEFRTKTIVQIMTMPVSPEVLVWGKFTASWLFCALALILTFPFWLTVNILGEPDNILILTAYFGSFVLAGCMLAVAQTMSALTKNQVIALVLAVAANLFFFWSGIEFVLSFFRLFTPDYIIDMIASFSFLTHFYNIAIGIVELRDILYFLSIILLFNFTTVLIVSFRTAGTASWLKATSRAYYIWAWIALLICFAGYNLLINNLTRGTQLDMTQDQIYSLDDTTVHLLQNLPEPVTAKLYFSDVLEQRNPMLRQMFDRVRVLLEQYQTASNGRFDYRVYHPQSLDYVEDRAIGDGLQPIPLIDINQNALFGLTLTDTLNNKKTIPMFMLERMAFLEQDITSLIYQLSHKKKTVGIISSLPIDGRGGSDSMIFQSWQVFNKIKETYNTRFISKPEDFAERPDVLMIIHPETMNENLINAIKNYSRDYGKILMLLDGAAEAPRLYSSNNRPLSPSNLNGLDEFWGFRFYSEYVVADLDNSITVDATQNYQNNPAFTQDVIQFKLQKENFNPAFKGTRHLKNILFASASIILPLENQEVSFTPLLQASKNSALMPMEMVYDGLNPRQILSYFKPDNNPKILAAFIQGKTNENPFTLIVVGDTDFIYDSFWTSPVPMMDKTYFMPLFNNMDFILNSLDLLTNDQDLVAIRGKSARDRTFKDIEKRRKENLFEFKVKEEEILNRLADAKNQIQEIWGKKTFEERETFTPDEMALIAGVRQQLDNLRLELSNLRLHANRSLEQTATLVKFLNIFAVPLFLTVLLLLLAFFKHQKKPVLENSFSFNRSLWFLTAFSLLILAAGLISVYVFNRSALERFEDKPLFPDLPQQLNDVQKIVIHSQKQTLTFSWQDGLWVLEEKPDFAVYQERIKSFLTSLVNARFYEKKSDKAENLTAFGLQPNGTDGSPNTRVELLNTNGALLQSFEVGDYNIDLGRGAMGAYIKFDNLFQVWLAEADLIDLSANWQPWTYSTLWNLRFGRLLSVNGLTDVDFLVNLAKELLNTAFTSSADSISDKKEVGTLNIKAEDDISVKLKFYRSGDKYYAAYQIEKPINNNHLEFFNQYAQDRYFEIPVKKWEKIKNAANF